MTIGAESVLKKRDKTVTRRIAGETLLVPIKGNLADMEHVFVLEGAGDFVWERIDGRRRVRDIAGELASEFGLDSETACGDVAGFADELVQAELVDNA